MCWFPCLSTSALAVRFIMTRYCAAHFFRAVVAVCLCWRRDDPDTWLHGACAMWLEGMVLDDTLSVVYSNATPSVPLPAGDLKCDVCGEAVRC